MLLSDPEIESSILISSDEGATYQKYRLNFYIQSLLFHPKQEDWVLAYSLDQKVTNSFQVTLSESDARDAAKTEKTYSFPIHSMYMECKGVSSTDLSRSTS